MLRTQEERDRAKGLATGCALLIVLAPILFLYSCISSCGQPTDAEREAELANFAKDADAEADRIAQFNQTQAPLWRASPDQLTSANVLSEISKCKQDIERGGSPYAWMYDDIDPKSTIGAVREGRPVLLTVEHRLDMIGERSVEWAQYRCYFKGAGYDHVEKDPNVHYTKNYMPDL